MYKNHPDISELNQWGKDYVAEAKVRIEKGIPIVVLGGSGFLHSLELTEVVNDWDLTTVTPKEAISLPVRSMPEETAVELLSQFEAIGIHSSLD